MVLIIINASFITNEFYCLIKYGKKLVDSQIRLK
jgi:hypothetical protein